MKCTLETGYGVSVNKSSSLLYSPSEKVTVTFRLVLLESQIESPDNAVCCVGFCFGMLFFCLFIFLKDIQIVLS